jgi:hypothetical protein
MPPRQTKLCQYAGCVERHQNSGAYCSQHSGLVQSAAWKRRAEQRKGDPIYAKYQSAAWKRFCICFDSAGNILCQAIVNGAQCTELGVIHHHLRAPETHPHLFFSFDNVVKLCRQHHPNTAGSSEEVLKDLDKYFVPTKKPRFFGG